MNDYVDANVLISFFLNDENTEFAELYFHDHAVVPLVSDWAAMEFIDVVLCHQRSGLIEQSAAEFAIQSFDRLHQTGLRQAAMLPIAVTIGVRLVRDRELRLAAPDALHLALTMESGYRLVTFDERLAAAARAKNVPVLVPSET